MKKINSIFLFIILLFSTHFISYGQVVIPVNDTVECMRAVGVAMDNGVPVDGVSVTLYKLSEEVEWTEVTNAPKHDHHFSFDLMGNSYYTIQVSKPGYVTRIVGISTQMPPTVVIDEYNPKTIFEFEVDLFKVKDGTDDYYLDFPIALVNYNLATKKFEQDKNYTTKLKANIGNVALPSDNSSKK